MRCLHFYVVVGKAFHHAIRTGHFKQYFAIGAMVLLRKILHLLVREIAECFVSFIAYVHGHYRLYTRRKGVGSF